MTLSISLKYPEYLMKKTVMDPVSSPEHSTKHESVKGIGKIIIISKLIYSYQRISKCWLSANTSQLNSCCY